MKKLIGFLVFAAILAFSGVSAKSQSEGQRLAVGFNFGLNKYWGEFTDNQFWWGGDLFLRYNIMPSLSLNASYNLGQVRYKTDADALLKYTNYFGLGAKEGDIYPGTPNTGINPQNSVRWMSGDLTASLNLFTTEHFVPYIFGGVGWMNWEAKSGNTGYGGPLPNNLKGVYEKSKLIFPVGVGFEFYLTDDLVLNAKGTYRLGMSEYFDDLSLAEDPNASSAKDQLFTFGLGFSYYILGDADYDNDGLTNSREKSIGSDPWNPDTDGEGLKDGEEVFVYYTDPLKTDTDTDGLTDYGEVFTHKTSPTKPDTDNDALLDGEEIARKTQPMNPDTDADGLLDGDEVTRYETDPLNRDTDGDGLKDGEEVLKYNTNPRSRDSDEDGLSDGEEVSDYKTNPANADSDSDGLNDGLEVNIHKTDPLKPDSDADGLSDGEEINNYKTNPLLTDTDGDSLSDGDEVKKYKTNPNNKDSDRDALSDGDEVNKFKTDPALPDTDSDALNDGDEALKHKTDPLKKDTDGDALNDGDEVTLYRTNPLKTDTDNDKLTDGIEVNRTKTDPLNPDTDGDKIIDGEDDCPLTPGVKSDISGKNGCPLPPKIGTKTDFPDILFIVNTDNFNFEYEGTIRNLTKLLEYVKQCDGIEIMLEGHASEEGNAARNQELSDMRAKKVREWLADQGAKTSKVRGTVGYGSSKPKIKEPKGSALKKTSKDALENIRKQNRRITVEVVKTCD